LICSCKCYGHRFAWRWLRCTGG